MSYDPCGQEMCRNWTGDGCACRVFGMEPDIVKQCDCCGCNSSFGETCLCDCCCWNFEEGSR